MYFEYRVVNSLQSVRNLVILFRAPLPKATLSEAILSEAILCEVITALFPKIFKIF